MTPTDIINEYWDVLFEIDKCDEYDDELRDMESRGQFTGQAHENILKDQKNNNKRMAWFINRKKTIELMAQYGIAVELSAGVSSKEPDDG